MTRPLILILIGLLATGCKSQAPTADPFFGRTTIAPPPTGSATGQPATPYYQTPPLVQTPSQTPASTSPPLVQMPAASSSAATQPVSPPGFVPNASAQPVSPPGFVPNVSAPRPTSTGPNGSWAPRPSPTAPPAGAASPYVPPGGSFNYRGASWQNSAPLVPARPDTQTSLPSVVGVVTSRAIAPSEDRTPGPVDDSTDVSVAGRKTIIQTIQPRTKGEASDRLINITDLPKAENTGAEVKPVRPAGP
jgi:hypothetical protein